MRTIPNVIGVVVPVGPEEHHAYWLDECLDSIDAQTRRPNMVIVVDDMHGRGLSERVRRRGAGWNVLSPRWRLGVGHAFNHGVALGMAHHADIMLMVGADDRIEPRVLEAVEEEYAGNGRRDGYYWCDVIYQDGTEQALPCNNAGVTAGLMRATGGLPVDASSGGMDAALISALLTHRPDLLIHVRGQDARYWSRQHEHQETARMNAYGAANAIIRDVFTQQFRAPRWGRYA